jgi:hypothetical protein
MKPRTGDLFSGHHRLQKLRQYTQVLDALTRLIDWYALARVVNEATGREASGLQRLKVDARVCIYITPANVGGITLWFPSSTRIPSVKSGKTVHADRGHYSTVSKRYYP